MSAPQRRHHIEVAGGSGAPHVLISAATGGGKGWDWRDVFEQLPEDWQLVVRDGKAPRPRRSRPVDETREEIE